MALNDGQLAQLAHAVHRHAVQLELLLGADDFWTHDLHVPVATQLRVLLCDRDLPILLTFAGEKHIPLRIWGPRPPGSGLNTQLLLSWSASVASWMPDTGGYEMSIEEYLDTGVAVIPVGQEGRAFSPRQIIKWVANKEGGAHFSFDKPATLEALKQSRWQSGDSVVESFQAKQVLQALGHWTHTAIGACLGIVPAQRP
jgi:hypothetical protein